jgi:septal ring factor EnvC (AmiA/AmiB activator)
MTITGRTRGRVSVSENKLENVGRRIGDISDLPEALRKQLQVARLDDLEEKIIKTIKERYENIATIDEIMVGLYRDFNHVIEDRRQLANKLYRMTKSGHIESVKERRGVFKLKDAS